ncbi:MAG TPA: tocopherol cyclase family protein [Solirubrobacter sp.]|nr:tocopherol cyclase family protein [Solirubrobacter sp.]
MTLASEPDGFERTVIADRARIDPHRLGVDAGPLRADEHGLTVDLGPGLDARFEARRDWPRPLGPLGAAQLVPWLGQYWAPHLLGARVSGRYGERSLDGADVYAEKNWGAAFARHWWWGQGPGVAFAGGRIHGLAPTAVVVWTDEDVLALAPPLACTVARAGGGEWRIRARSPRYRVELEGEARGGHRLYVPVPAERRLEPRSNHFLTGTVRYTVWRGRRVWVRREGLAGLEDGAV